MIYIFNSSCMLAISKHCEITIAIYKKLFQFIAVSQKRIIFQIHVPKAFCSPNLAVDNSVFVGHLGYPFAAGCSSQICWFQSGSTYTAKQSYQIAQCGKKSGLSPLMAKSVLPIVPLLAFLFLPQISGFHLIASVRYVCGNSIFLPAPVSGIHPLWYHVSRGCAMLAAGPLWDREQTEQGEHCYPIVDCWDVPSCPVLPW